jgi:hypothetical protein
LQVHACYRFCHGCEFKWVCMLTLRPPFFPFYSGRIVSLTVSSSVSLFFLCPVFFFFCLRIM